MKRTALALIVVIVLLISAVAVIHFVRLATANFMPPQPHHPHIYIRSDGTVDPQTTLIQRVEDTYILAGNIFNYTLEIQRGNIMLDGAGYMLDGYGIGRGIFIANISNVTVKNIEIKRFATGIDLHQSLRITITESRITSNDIGIAVADSSNNQILKNHIVANNAAILLYAASNNTIGGNNITKNRDGIWCENTTPRSEYNNIVGNNITANTDHGIMLRSTSHNRIEANNICNNDCGIWLSQCSDSTFYHNDFVNNSKSVSSFGSPNVWERNYWSDYSGTDANGDGVGDTPYVVETQTVWYEPITNTPIIGGVNTQDNYPLIASLCIPNSPDGKSIITPTVEHFQATFIMASVAAIAIVSTSFVIYFKTRARKPKCK